MSVADNDLTSNVAVSYPETRGGSFIFTGLNNSDKRILPHPKPPTNGNHLYFSASRHAMTHSPSKVTPIRKDVLEPDTNDPQYRICNRISQSILGKFRHSPCSLSLSSLTTNTIFAKCQSRINRSETALKYGNGVNCFVLVRYTSRSFRCTSTYAEGGSGFSAGVRSTTSARAGLPAAAESRELSADE